MSMFIIDLPRRAYSFLPLLSDISLSRLRLSEAASDATSHISNGQSTMTYPST